VKPGPGGFTLLEVLVALALTVLVLQPLLALSRQTLRAAELGDRRAAALRLAERLLIEAAELPTAIQATQGRSEEGLSWRRSLAPLAPPGPGVRPVQIEVAVDTGEGGEVRLVTARLLPAEPAGRP